MVHRPMSSARRIDPGTAPGPPVAPHVVGAPAPATSTPPRCDGFEAHYVFLVHGFLGIDREMSYVQTALANAAAAEGEGAGTGVPIVVHRVRCNNGRTSDGIAAGGDRLANEIVDVIKGNATERRGSDSERRAIDERDAASKGEGAEEEERHVTLSVVGYSLGGLYARYALSLLPAQLGRLVLHPGVFCTMATPHLGVASHTYFPLPRALERVVGAGLGSTGRDLFRLDSGGARGRGLVYRMATEVSFVSPLSRFRRRVAYVNAYGTDFQVPTNTAAFLSPNSAYPHRLDRVYREEFVATVLRTERQDWRDFDATAREWPPMEDEVLTMSSRLDSLGWTKVFVDIRGGIPAPSIPRPALRRGSSRARLERFVERRRESESDADASSSSDGAEVVIESRELVTLMNVSDRLQLPMGHTVMVVNSKNVVESKLNEKGKPVMDMLASDLIRDIINFGTLEGEKDYN